MSADLIVYALVAAGLVFWLRSILGTRHGDERDRPTPYLNSAADAPAAAGRGDQPAEADNAEQKISDLARNPTDIMAIDSRSAESGLVEIARQDKTFDVRHFLQGAQDAFAYIVEAFAQGDSETLRDLLEPPVYEAFAGAITQRESRGETQKTEIHAIRCAEILGAAIRNKVAYITVRFRADETTATYDSTGALIAGHPEKTTEMRDVWVFARALRARDPRWLLHETRGEDGDNDIIPNSNA